jgi:hypothetical protein
MPHKAKKPNNTRLCPVSIGAATPHRTLIESRIAQTAIQNRSTDPKNSGARINATIAVQSWIELNIATGNSDCGRRIIAMKS